MEVFVTRVTASWGSLVLTTCLSVAGRVGWLACVCGCVMQAKHLVLNHMSNRYRRMGPDLDSPFDEKVSRGLLLH